MERCEGRGGTRKRKEQRREGLNAKVSEHVDSVMHVVSPGVISRDLLIGAVRGSVNIV
jgi:hypothetical protein